MFSIYVLELLFHYENDSRLFFHSEIEANKNFDSEVKENQNQKITIILNRIDFNNAIDLVESLNDNSKQINLREYENI